MSEEQPEASPPTSAWIQRTAEQSPAVLRSRLRSIERAEQIVRAAHRLIAQKGSTFTTQELAKEAGIALQTLYTHFGSKDQVILAVLEEMITSTCSHLEERGSSLPDPLARLHLYVTSLVPTGPNGRGVVWTQFITSEHWRLQKMWPEELARVTRPVIDLLLPQITGAAAAGLIEPLYPEYEAWLISQLITAVFHYQEHAGPPAGIEDVGERVWRFCLRALGGRLA